MALQGFHRKQRGASCLAQALGLSTMRHLGGFAVGSGLPGRASRWRLLKLTEDCVNVRPGGR